MLDLQEVKQEYFKLIENERKNILKLKNNQYKQSFLNSLTELEQKIRYFKGEDYIILGEFGKSIFQGGNVNILSKHLFNNPLDKSIYADGFFNSVGSSQTSVYKLIIKGENSFY